MAAKRGNSRREKGAKKEISAPLQRIIHENKD